MEIRRNGLRKARNVAQSRVGRRNFGKMWDSGDKGHVFYRVYSELNPETEKYEWDIMGVYIFGHRADPKLVKLQHVFLPTTSEIDPETGEPKEADILVRLSQLCKAMVWGEYAKLIHDADEQLSDEILDKAEYAARVAEIQKDFEYDAEKKIIKKRGAIGPLIQLTNTECVYVKEDPTTGKFDMTKAECVSQDLSTSRLDCLFDCLEEAEKLGMLVPGETQFLEIGYKFGKKGDKKQDGNVDPFLIKVGDRIVDKFPELEPQLNSLCRQIPEDPELIKKHNNSFKPVPVEAIASAGQSFAKRQIPALNNLCQFGTDADKEHLVKCAEIFTAFNLKVKDDVMMEKIAKKAADIQRELEEELDAEEDGEVKPSLSALKAEREADFKEELKAAKEASAAEVDGATEIVGNIEDMPTEDGLGE